MIINENTLFGSLKILQNGANRIAKDPNYLLDNATIKFNKVPITFEKIESGEIAGVVDNPTTMLLPGPKINELINKNSTSFHLTSDYILPSSTDFQIIDISLYQNGSVLTWYIPDAAHALLPHSGGIMKEQVWWAKDLNVLDESTFPYLNKDSSQMFYNVRDITTIDMRGFNTSKVTNMKDMFIYCISLKEIEVSRFDTSNVTDMSWMFSGLGNLTSLDVSHFNTSNVTNMGKMFNGCSMVPVLDVSKFDTSKVTDMSSMFNYCGKLTVLDVSHFNTSKVTDMSMMFLHCNVNLLNLSGFNTSQVTTMESMFDCGNKLTTITYGMNFVNTNVENFFRMFNSCPANKPTWTNGTWDSEGTFLRTATLTTGPTINAAINKSATSFARSTTAPISTIATTDISEKQDKSIVTWYDTTNTTQYWYCDLNMYIVYMNPDSSHMFEYANCKNLISIDILDFNTSKVTDMSWMFGGCMKLTSLDLFNFDTSKVTNMNHMFYSCEALTSLDVSGFETTNVTDMSSMFGDLTSLTVLDISNFNTSNVTDMNSMFYGCCVESLDFLMFDTSNVTNMGNMFNYCGMKSLDLSNFNTSKVTTMQCMFVHSRNLTSLDLSSFDTSNVTSMWSMFMGNDENALVSLNLSSFNTSKVTSMNQMFLDCSKLTDIKYGPNFVNTGITEPGVYYILQNCPANKPTWTNGTWNESIGTFTFIKNP